MQLFHFIAAWLFPGAACSSPKAATTKAMTAESSSVPDDNASSMAFSVKAADDDSASSISSSSSSPSSSSDDHPRFFTSRHQHQHSPPASPLCFGAGGAAGRFLRGSRAARARSPTKHEAAAAKASMSPAPAAKGDAVGRYLRKISRRLRKARAAAASNKGSPPSISGGAGDDTARERAKAVARAISYCKETLRLGAEAPPPSPSLGDLLHGRQPEIIASAAACCGDGSAGSKTPPPMQATGKQAGKDKEATRPVSPSRDSSVTGSDIIVHGKELPRHGHDAMDKCCGGEPATMAEPATSSSPSDLAADEMRMPDGSFDEMEFLKNFDGDEEMIGHHFITLHI